MLETRTLVVFSGGKESLLAACKCVERGEHVGLIAFNNGCLSSERSILGSAKRLINRYGEKLVSYEGICSTYSLYMHLTEWWANATYGDVATQLAGSSNAQTICWHCQAAMGTTAVAYALAKGFSVVSIPYHPTEEVCTGAQAFLGVIRALTDKYKLELDLPLWNMGDLRLPWESVLDRELSKYGIYPATMEPTCMLGRPSLVPVSRVADILNDYTDTKLMPIMLQQLPELRETFRAMKLTAKSLNEGEYVIPDVNIGMY